jgi:hypothetical protein
MEVFGIIGMALGATGFVFALNAVARLAKLEKQLKSTGVLDQEYRS